MSRPEQSAGKRSEGNRRVSNAVARVTLADIDELSDRAVSSLQQHGYIVPIDLRYASRSALETLDGVRPREARRIKTAFTRE